MGKNRNSWRIASGISASLLAFFIGGYSIATANTTWVNSTLQTPSEKIVNESGETPYYFTSDYETVTDLLEAKNDLLERISEEGSVLLKNDNSVLPLSETAKVTLLGAGSVSPAYGGTIGSSIKEAGTETIVSIEQALTERGFQVNPEMVSFYSGQTIERSMSSFMFGVRYDELDTAQIGEIPVSTFVSAGIATENGSNGAVLTDEAIGDYSDAAIVVITRASSEAAEYNITSATTEDGDSYDSPLDLTTYEKEVIDLAINSFDKVIVLLNTDQAMGIDYLKQTDGVDAVLWTGLPGAKGFYGVADILNGTENPSGHLVDTFAVHPASAPANANMGLYLWNNASTLGGDENTSADYGKADWYVIENEGIYVGYKYYETRYEDAVNGDEEALNSENATSYVKSYSDYDASKAWDYNDQVSYSFGYGLSYTTFSMTLDAVDVDLSTGEGTATVTVKNTGNVDGKAVIQLYVQAPYTEGGVEKASVQLVDFDKVMVPAGGSETVDITFEIEDFTSYDTSKGQWILDEGNYYFAVGNGAHEALNSILLAKGYDSEMLTISTEQEQANALSAKQVAISDTKAFLDTINENVENRFEQADYKTYDPSYSYVTRSDWSKGWETMGSADGSDSIAYTQEMAKGLFAELYEFTENEKTSDMNFDWENGSGLTIMDFIGVGIDESIEKDGVTYTYDDLVNAMSLEEAMFFLENQYQNLDSISSIGLGEVVTNDGPAGFAYDQVPGYAYNWQLSELDEPTYVSSSDENAETSMAVYNTEPVVAATFNKELAFEEGYFMGEDALWADENLIIGPGVNLHRSPYNARNHEYYSEDSVLTSLMAAALCQGGYSKGLMMEAKHYAFNHQEINRCGLTTFFDEQAGRENELRCFRLIMEENLTQAVMTAFNRIGVEFAGACEAALKGVARDEWGFEGAVVTDMVNGAMYMNWRDSIAAGLSGTLGTNAYATTSLGASITAENLQTISKDAYFQQQVHDATKYWLYEVANSNYMNTMDSTSQLKQLTPWWKTALIVAMVVSGLLTILSMLMFGKQLMKQEV